MSVYTDWKYFGMFCTIQIIKGVDRVGGSNLTCNYLRKLVGNRYLFHDFLDSKTFLFLLGTFTGNHPSGIIRAPEARVTSHPKGIEQEHKAQTSSTHRKKRACHRQQTSVLACAGINHLAATAAPTLKIPWPPWRDKWPMTATSTTPN